MRLLRCVCVKREKRERERGKLLFIPQSHACDCCVFCLCLQAAGKGSISLHVVQDDPVANQLYLNYGYKEQTRDNFISAK